MSALVHLPGVTATPLSEFLGFLSPSLHLVAITPDGPIEGKWFGADVAAAEVWAGFQNEAGRNVYWTVNQSTPGLDKKPTKSGISGVRFGHVDIDPPKDGSAFDKQAVLAHLMQRGNPSMVIDSGNGLQALWTLDAISGDVRAIETINRGIEAVFHADHCWNVDRLLRVPFLTNYPNEKKRKAGRVPVQTSLLVPFNGNIFNMAALASAFPAPPAFDPDETSLTDGPCEGYTGPEDDDKLIEMMLRSNGGAMNIFTGKATVADLWNRNVPVLATSYPDIGGDYGFDHSAADAALFAHLAFWTGRNGVRMDRLFRRSGLMRDKYANRPGYRSETIRKSVGSCKAIYNVEPKATKLALPGVTITVPAVGTVAAPASWMSIVSPDDLDMRGKPVPNLRNTLVAMRNDPNLKGVVGYDEMERCVMITGHLPRVDCPRPANDAPVIIIPMADHHVSYVLEYLQATGLPKLSNGTVFDALTTVARDNFYHPVRDYLSRLRWDGAPRLSSWLTTYCGVEANEYTAAVGCKWFISAVARVFDPGCQVDTTLILEGPQGARKSSVVRTLAGVWFSDNLPDVARDSKELSQHLRGKWIIEIPEMASLYRANPKTLKAFLSRTVERYRPSYGRLDVTEPRQCVFIATTNEDEYLQDDTGARRFWPVQVGAQCDTDALTRDRDQLFAEAVAAYRAGEKWWLDEAHEELARAETAERQIEDPWAGPVQAYLNEMVKANPYARVNVRDIVSAALPGNVEAGTIVGGKRIRRLIRSHGWKKAPKINGVTTFRLNEPPDYMVTAAA